MYIKDDEICSEVGFENIGKLSSSLSYRFVIQDYFYSNNLHKIRSEEIILKGHLWNFHCVLIIIF